MTTPYHPGRRSAARGRHVGRAALRFLALLSLALSAHASALAQDRGAVPRFDPAPPGMPFSKAVSYGGILYLSGEIGADPETGRLVPGGIRAEARQALENIKATLARHGLGIDAVFKCTVMLADMADWPAFNEVYVGYFAPGRLPARSAFGTSGLALDGRLEIECWAAMSAADGSGEAVR